MSNEVAPEELQAVVKRVGKDDNGNDVIHLGADSRILPIYVGSSEGIAIGHALRGEETPRPLSAQLTVRLMELGGQVVDKAVITEIRDRAFIAELHISGADGGQVVVDARSSDAIALALLTDAPIFVTAAVLEDAALSAEQVPSDLEPLRMKPPQRVPPPETPQEMLGAILGNIRGDEASILVSAKEDAHQAGRRERADTQIAMDSGHYAAFVAFLREQLEGAGGGPEELTAARFRCEYEDPWGVEVSEQIAEQKEPICIILYVKRLSG